MSEYQHYEFTAVDRPLTTREQGKLRSLSTRADITATSFINTYQWGNFKGDPHKLMERYFDAHLYLANWSTRQLMLRLPKGCSTPPPPPTTASATVRPRGPPASTSSSTSTGRTRTAPTSGTSTA